MFESDLHFVSQSRDRNLRYTKFIFWSNKGCKVGDVQAAFDAFDCVAGFVKIMFSWHPDRYHLVLRMTSNLAFSPGITAKVAVIQLPENEGTSVARLFKKFIAWGSCAAFAKHFF